MSTGQGRLPLFLSKLLFNAIFSAFKVDDAGATTVAGSFVTRGFDGSIKAVVGLPAAVAAVLALVILSFSIFLFRSIAANSAKRFFSALTSASLLRFSAFIAAAIAGHASVASLLLDAKADVNHFDNVSSYSQSSR